MYNFDVLDLLTESRKLMTDGAGVRPVSKFYIVGSMIQISGWKDPFETDSSLTKNIWSRRMNPSPIFHRLSVDTSMAYDICSSVLDNRTGIPP